MGYLVMGGGLAVVKWPLLFNHGPWELKEVAWKLTWLGVVAVPLWLDNNKLDGATREQAGGVLWVVIIIAVIPWRHVLIQYVMASGDPWRCSG